MGRNDVFGDDYFSRHRGESWSKLQKDEEKVHKYLNVKNYTPKVAQEEMIPVDDPEAAEVLETEMEEESSGAGCSFCNVSELAKLLVAGFIGGLVVFIFGLKYILNFPTFSFVFWASIIEIFLVAVIVLLVVAILLAMIRRK